MKRSTWHKIERLSLIVFAIILISTGVVHIIRGSMGWKNYWGGLVFLPFAVVFGLLLIYVVIFRWRKLQERPRDKKGREPEPFEDDWRKW
jgi:formate/nitrite transporter FocA (FNT family)